MYAPYPENMMESIKKVEATREARMKTEPRRLTAEEKDDLLEKFHHLLRSRLVPTRVRRHLLSSPRCSIPQAAL